jgi:hypothetical protein
MNLPVSSQTDQDALRRAMEYWVSHWNWECPLLFGMELEALKEVLSAWPSIPEDKQQLANLASAVSLRELLHGASAVPKSRVSELIGVSYEAACALCRTASAVAA